MEIGGVALRDVILMVSGLTGVYLVIMILRLLQIGRHKEAASDEEFEAQAPQDGEDEGKEAEGETYLYPKPVIAETVPPASFGAELTRSHLEREVKQLREEIATLRGELSEIKAARHVSPQYADAMALVQRGLTAQDVADRCGISLAEAELVWALARGPQNFDQEDDYGGEPGRTQTRSA